MTGTATRVSATVFDQDGAIQDKAWRIDIANPRTSLRKLCHLDLSSRRRR